MITKTIDASTVQLLKFSPAQIDAFTDSLAEFLAVWPLFPDELKGRLRNARPEYQVAIERLLNTLKEAS